MLSYKALINNATQQIYNSSDTPRIDAEVLMQHVLGKSTAWLMAYGDTIASAEHSKAFYSLLAGRQKGQPIAYLTGSRDFWSLTLKVDENVLIPRPDTETLVEEALKRLPKNRQLAVLDLGTGSGAIALSIAKERPNAHVIALEYQRAALEIAQQNSKLNDIDNIEFRLSDWYQAITHTETFDLIASNPPYIEQGNPHLNQGDLRFEPSTALVAQNSGLADLQTIIDTAPKCLNNNGWLIVEHGYNQASEVALLFKSNGFSDIECFKDINDLPRCTQGKKS